jgi:hypothetical protein
MAKSVGREQRAEMQAFDMLALRVAERVLEADVFITHRPYLYSESALVSKLDVTISTLDDAIPRIALYLRAQGEFDLPTPTTASAPQLKFGFKRGLYYWVGARELLPEAWRWYSACAQHSSGVGNDKLLLLGGSMLSRVTKALQERDLVHIALNKPPNIDTSDEALSSLDNVLVSLMGAVDVTARVAHYVLNLSGDEYSVGWQRDGWCNRVAANAPALAAIVQSGTPERHTLTILRKLRNSVHGTALEGVMYSKDEEEETRVGLPPDDEAAILEAMSATGGPESWGVLTQGAGLSLVRPAVLVDRLFEEVLLLLNNLMKETPVERLGQVTISADMCKPPREDPSKGTFDTFSEWNRSAIRWQLGF